MMYVFLMLYGLLTGGLTGWFMYNACAGTKGDRLWTAILCGVLVWELFALFVQLVVDFLENI